ncbi:hypothetical protein ACS0TY_035598 [Phlomoides rotata]
MMRLIGGVRPPSETTLLRQFQVNKTSTAHMHPVLIEASGHVNDGRSYAASAPPDVIQARKPRKRIPKSERKSMVEQYVKKYRATNAGKFPSAKDAMKDVGGSYYTIRQILQELIYNSKQPPRDTKEISLKKSTTGKDDITANIGVVSPTKGLGKVMRPTSEVCVEDSTSMMQNTRIIESTEKLVQQSSVLKEASVSDEANIFRQTDKSEDDGSHFHHLIGKPESSQLPDPENNIEQENLNNKLPQESTETLRRESHRVPTDAEPQTSISVWNNLKSFANGIISLWKRS